MNLPILYSFRRCPYAMRARLTLFASGIQYEHREVVLRNKPAEMLAASPKATVPVLVLPNGEVIDQSLDIMLWALRQNDQYDWLENQEEALALIAQCDSDFKFHLDRYKYANRYEGANALEHRAHATVFAKQIDADIARISYKFNSCSGIKYAGCMPFIRQFSIADKLWFAAQALPYLQSTLSEFEASPEFKSIMQHHPPWVRD